LDLENLVTAEAIGREALKLEPAERESFIAQRCGENSKLRGEVEFFVEMQSHAAAAPQPSPVVDAGARRVEVRVGGEPAEKTKRRLPEHIGPYRVIDQIGQGGFGIVYLAEQEQPVRRRVALKVIKLGMDTPEVLARFEAERQALAMMDHPGVARVFDAGTTEMGRPYFAMEFVQGVPITDYCDKNRLPNRERLELFILVCEAVQHAHQKGIIHRDLKPSNIMVTLQDGKPAPKVIDFGIAKALHQKLTDHTLYTERGQLMGTPEYMSPEQAEMSGMDIDTRADIYSLGVVLYQLLVGSLPIDSASLRVAGPLAVQRAIREQDAQKPSTLLQTRRELTPSIAHNRNTDPDTLIRQIRGDLDWITLKAVEKDRTRRYASASELAADVRRYLNDEPVLATPPSTAYRMKKFVRRHRAFVLASTAASLALVVGLSLATYGLVQARTERDRAARERDRAVAAEAAQRREREKAEQVAAFMSETLSGVGPAIARGRDTTMLREMMDAAAQRIEKGELKAAPQAEIRLRETIGSTYRQLANFDKAESMLKPALTLARATYPANAREMASLLQECALLSIHTGDVAAAEAQARESLSIWQYIYSGDHDSVASCQGVLAEALLAKGDLAGAEANYRGALAMHERLFGPNHVQVAADLSNISVTLTSSGDVRKAAEFGERALAIRKAAIQGDHPEIAANLDNLAVLYDRAGNPQLAEKRCREALEMRRRLYPGDHDQIAGNLANLAVFLQHCDKLDEARQSFLDALAMQRRLLPADHPRIAGTMRNLGELEKARGDREAASRYFNKALAIHRKAYPGDHMDLAMSLDSVGMLLWDEQKYEAAEPYLRQSAEMIRRLTGGKGDDFARSLFNLGDTVRRLGHLDEAEKLEREALGALDKAYPGDHPMKLIILGNLAVTLQKAGRPDEAAALLRQRIDMRKRLSPANPIRATEDLSRLTDLLYDQGRFDDAIATHREECDIWSKYSRPGDPTPLGCIASLGLLIADVACREPPGSSPDALKKARESESMLRANLATRAKVLKADDWRLAHTRNGLGEAIFCVAILDHSLSDDAKSARLTEAEKLLTESLPSILDAPGAPLRRRRQAAERVMRFYESTGQADQAAAYRRKVDALAEPPASQPAARPS